MKNPFYVYALKDRRTKPAKPFYIGKGTGNRIWEHVKDTEESEKVKTIKEIEDSGYNVIHTKIADNLTEEQALKIEAELISAFGIISQGGLLTNRVKPNTDNIKRNIKVNIPDGCYEKAQMGLTFLKQAVIEFSQANLKWINKCGCCKIFGPTIIL